MFLDLYTFSIYALQSFMVRLCWLALANKLISQQKKSSRQRKAIISEKILRVSERPCKTTSELS